MITILTPTYNRAHTLPRLYNSLVKQFDKSFEWLVIDDGSTDDTDVLILGYKKSSIFKIRYIKKKNGGKHSALNFGFKIADYEWILLLDSDDWLDENCISRLNQEIGRLTEDYNSITMLNLYEDGSVVGDEFPMNIENYMDMFNSKVRGDKADCFRKSALREFSFPEYINENFMAERPVYLWLAEKGKTKFINYGGYFCEYQSNGLSDGIINIKNRVRCFKSTLYVYDLQYRKLNDSSLRIKAAINWWRFRPLNARFFNEISIPLIYLPFGLFLKIKDRLNIFKSNFV